MIHGLRFTSAKAVYMQRDCALYTDCLSSTGAQNTPKLNSYRLLLMINSLPLSVPVSVAISAH